MKLRRIFLYIASIICGLLVFALALVRSPQKTKKPLQPLRPRLRPHKCGATAKIFEVHSMANSVALSVACVVLEAPPSRLRRLGSAACCIVRAASKVSKCGNVVQIHATPNAPNYATYKASNIYAPSGLPLSPPKKVCPPYPHTLRLRKNTRELAFGTPPLSFSKDERGGPLVGHVVEAAQRLTAWHVAPRPPLRHLSSFCLSSCSDSERA